MTDEEAAQLRAQVHEATRVLSGAYTIPAPRQAALTEEYAETFASAVERLLDERAALVESARVLAGYTPEHSDYSGYYLCQFCQEERRETPPYDMDIDGWRAWLTHASDCPVMKARALLDGEKRP